MASNTKLEVENLMDSVQAIRRPSRASIIQPRIPLDKDEVKKRRSIEQEKEKKSPFGFTTKPERYSEEEQKYLKNDLKTSDTIGAVISCLGIVLSWIENEIFFDNNNVSNVLCHIIRGIITASCLVLNLFIYNHYKLELEILKSKKLAHSSVTFCRSSMRKKYVIECIINSIHCPPGVDIVLRNRQLGKEFEVSLDAYISVVMLGRLYIFFRLFDHYTVWTGERAKRVCKMNGFIADSTFAIKAYLKYRALYFLSLALGISIIIFGMTLRTLERPNRLNYDKFDYIWNSFWCVIVTMATIGYGDIVPKTHLGRLVILISAIWGTFILSLFVVTLSNIVILSKNQNKAYADLVRVRNIKAYLYEDAARIVLTYLKILKGKKKKEDSKKMFLMRMDLMGMMDRFKIKRKNVLNITETIPNLLEEMQTDLNEKVKELSELLIPLKSVKTQCQKAHGKQVEIEQGSSKILESTSKFYNFLLEFKEGTSATYKNMSEYHIKTHLADEITEDVLQRDINIPWMPNQVIE